MTELTGRHVLVTGAGRGIGAAIAEDAAAHGALVTLLARSEDQLAEVAARIESAGGRARIHVADIGDEEQADAAVRAAHAEQPLWGVVNNAGMNRPGPVDGYPMADFDAIMWLNVRATFMVCRAAGPLMAASGGGRIVNMSSQMGSVGYPGRSAYCASKHAVNGMTKAMAVEWAEQGVTVNAVAPTFVETEWTQRMFADPDFRRDVFDRIPARRLATTDEVASATTFLLSPRNGSTTGQILGVDGGWTAW